MNEILSEICTRRARRALDNKVIPDGIIQRLLEAAVLAPSCMNNQPWRFVVVTGESELNAVKTYLPHGNSWALESPCIILAATKSELDCRLSDSRDYALFDLGLAVNNLMLQAEKEGIIAHPIAGFKPVEIKESVHIPGDYTLIALIVCGFPGDPGALPEDKRDLESLPRERKAVEEIASFNSWNFT